MPGSTCLPGLDRSFAQEVKEKSGQSVELCYQCQKCAAGCAMGNFADYAPNQILRLVQFGAKERVLRSSAIWFCLSCEICSARCPNDIKIAEIMDVLREMALAANVSPVEKRSPLFHRIFLDSVKKRGRVHEAFLIAEYKLKSRDLFSDLGTGFEMLRKGKLPLLTRGVKNKALVRKIFKRIKES